jgi:polysaccharide export outer membrane protein
LLRSSEKQVPEILKAEPTGVEREYLIQKNDQLSLNIYLYNGERLVDPNPPVSSSSTTGAGGQKEESTQFKYTVDNNGVVKFPMIGEIKLEGLNLRQAEEIARKEYTKYFKEPYVQLAFLNKRVVVLGGTPAGQVIPLTNSNMRLPEILALAHGIENHAWAKNIRVVRNDHVYEFNLSTIQGFKDGNIPIEPGDIIYVEPVRRPFTEGFRENYFVVSIFIALISVTALIRSIK